jgi:hypothetical protein
MLAKRNRLIWLGQDTTVKISTVSILKLIKIELSDTNTGLLGREISVGLLPVLLLKPSLKSENAPEKNNSFLMNFIKFNFEGRNFRPSLISELRLQGCHSEQQFRTPLSIQEAPRGDNSSRGFLYATM